MFLKTKIVGVLNVASDSFSDGKEYTKSELKDRIEYLIDAGADIIDVGAESTAPGSQPILLEEELERLQDFFSICGGFSIPFSLDTTKSQVAEKGIEHGIKIINDVSGGRQDPEMFNIISQHHKVNYVMMYCKNPSGRADSDERESGDMITMIKEFFDDRIKQATQSGIKEDQIIIDPGMGAFVSPDFQDSIDILKNIKALKEHSNLPLLIGSSRKGFLGKIIKDDGPQDRVGSSLASTVFAILQGAEYIRVHDVKEMKQFIEVWNVLYKENIT